MFLIPENVELQYKNMLVEYYFFLQSNTLSATTWSSEARQNERNTRHTARNLGATADMHVVFAMYQVLWHESNIR